MQQQQRAIVQTQPDAGVGRKMDQIDPVSGLVLIQEPESERSPGELDELWTSQRRPAPPQGDQVCVCVCVCAHASAIRHVLLSLCVRVYACVYVQNMVELDELWTSQRRPAPPQSDQVCVCVYVCSCLQL